MKKGKNSADTCRLNGWKVGDILEGDEGYGPSRIKITAIGEIYILAKWDKNCNGNFREECSTSVEYRDWKKVQ